MKKNFKIETTSTSLHIMAMIFMIVEGYFHTKNISV